MIKHLLGGLVVLFFSFMCINVAMAGVIPIAGAVDPVVSTEDNPVWYTIMSSHITETDRQSRFIRWDSDLKVLNTKQYRTGIPDEDLTDDFLWRLERGSDDTKVYFVNRGTGYRITLPNSGITPENNTQLLMSETGSEWRMYVGTTLNNQCVAKQYCFDYEGLSDHAYLNAMGGNVGQPEMVSYGITVYKTGIHQASGWFFYEADVAEPVKYPVNFDVSPLEGGSLTITNRGADVSSGDEIRSGTELTGSITYATHYELESLVINGVDETGSVTSDGTFKFSITEETTLSVKFRMKEYVVSLQLAPEDGGTLVITKNGVPVNSGDKVEPFTELEGKINCGSYYHLGSLKINNSYKTSEVGEDGVFGFTVEEDTRIIVQFEPKVGTVNFAVTPEEGGELSMEWEEYPITSGEEVELGVTLIGKIKCNPGYAVKSITVNEEDRTSDVREDNTFDCLVENEDGTNVAVEFTNSSSGVDSEEVRINIPTCFVDNLIVNGLDKGDILTLYTYAGQAIDTQIAHGTDVILNVTDVAKGYYILQIRQHDKVITIKTLKK